MVTQWQRSPMESTGTFEVAIVGLPDEFNSRIASNGFIFADERHLAKNSSRINRAVSGIFVDQRQMSADQSNFIVYRKKGKATAAFAAGNPTSR
jgi:hypothetical protein